MGREPKRLRAVVTRSHTLLQHQAHTHARQQGWEQTHTHASTPHTKAILSAGRTPAHVLGSGHPCPQCPLALLRLLDAVLFMSDLSEYVSCVFPFHLLCDCPVTTTPEGGKSARTIPQCPQENWPLYKMGCVSPAWFMGDRTPENTPQLFTASPLWCEMMCQVTGVLGEESQTSARGQCLSRCWPRLQEHIWLLL